MNEDAKEKEKEAGARAVKRLESLSCLRISAELRSEMETQTFSAIDGWFASVQKIDTGDVAPMTSPRSVQGGAQEELREDKVDDGGKREQLLANAPASQHGFFLVPKVIE